MNTNKPNMCLNLWQALPEKKVIWSHTFFASFPSLLCRLQNTHYLIPFQETQFVNTSFSRVSSFLLLFLSAPSCHLQLRVPVLLALKLSMAQIITYNITIDDTSPQIAYSSESSSSLSGGWIQLFNDTPNEFPGQIGLRNESLHTTSKGGASFTIGFKGKPWKLTPP